MNNISEGNPTNIEEIPNDNLNENSNNLETQLEDIEDNKNSENLPINKNMEFSEEVERLGGKRALPTMILLSVGPFISQLSTALYGIVDTMWVSKAIGDRGMTAISTYSNFDTISRAFGYFLGVSISSMASSLFGSGEGSETGQLLSDLIRIGFFFGIIIPLIFLPITRPIARWFGASEEIVELGRLYVFPLLISSIVPCLYLLVCGCLQAEGRAKYFTVVQLTACILNLIIFDPLFLFGFKTDISGAAWATVLAELIPTLYVLYEYYKGKLGIKPKLNQLFQPFSKYTLTSLKIGSSQFIFMLSLALPGIIMRKYLGMTCLTVEIYNDVMAAYNTLLRIYVVISSVGASMVMGFVPAASYSFGAKRLKRVIYLLTHGLWISTLWCLVCMIFTVGFPSLPASLFSTSKGYLNWSIIILKNSTYLAFLTPIPLLIQALLQSLQNGYQATILSLLTQLLPLPLFSIIFYYIDKTNPGKIFFSYFFQQLFGALIAIPFGLPQIIKIIKNYDDD